MADECGEIFVLFLRGMIWREGRKVRKARRFEAGYGARELEGIKVRKLRWLDGKKVGRQEGWKARRLEGKKVRRQEGYMARRLEGKKVIW